MKTFPILVLLSICAGGQALPSDVVIKIEQPAIVTFYSSGTSKGLYLGTGTRSAWGNFGQLFEGRQRLIKAKGISNHRFVSFRIKPGQHEFSGPNGWGHPSTEKTKLTFEAGKRYFAKLSTVHKGWGAYGTYHYFIELVPCEQAYAEAVNATPVKTKHLDKVAIQMIEPEMYFPKCETTLAEQE